MTEDKDSDETQGMVAIVQDSAEHSALLLAVQSPNLAFKRLKEFKKKKHKWRNSIGKETSTCVSTWEAPTKNHVAQPVEINSTEDTIQTADSSNRPYLETLGMQSKR